MKQILVTERQHRLLWEIRVREGYKSISEAVDHVLLWDEENPKKVKEE